MKRGSILLVLFAVLAAAGPAPAAAASGFESLIASTSSCPNQTDPSAPLATQERAMRCLTNFARRGRGLPLLAPSTALNRAARHKSADILSCDSFSHDACGRPFTYWMEHFGYLTGCASAGENIAWGTGSLGGVRSIFRAWMHSAGHRENILGPYGEIGIGLRVGELESTHGARVWTQDFGSRC